jgi:secondary thiamine-phosphate synthase enzyme
MVRTLEIRLHTDGEGDVQNLTPDVERCLEHSGVREGLATVFVIGSTAAISTMEYEPGLREDVPRALERIAPSNDVYRHELTWQDDNGHSHVKATLLGPSLTVPVAGGRLTLGTWQQIVLIELDTRSRDRQVVVQFVGEQ